MKYEYDLFISHASEDKEAIALPLTEMLRQRGLRVWLDKYELTIGDSLQSKIDQGLKNSRFGVVILSHAFFAKKWPQAELNALFSMKTEDESTKILLPIWHRMSREDVAAYSPLLAGLFAAETSKGLDAVVNDIILAVSRSTPNRIKNSFVAYNNELSLQTYSGLAGKSSGGVVHGVPNLPAFYMERKQLLQRLKVEVLQASSSAVTVTPVCAHGMAGIGKTMLAAALAHEQDVLVRFPGGIYWLTFGQHTEPFGLQQNLFRTVTGKKPLFVNPTEGRDVLRHLLGGEKVLLILDDIWKRSQVESLQVVSDESRLLLTTRNLALVKELGAEAIPLEMLDEAEARALFVKTSKQDPSAGHRRRPHRRLRFPSLGRRGCGLAIGR